MRLRKAIRQMLKQELRTVRNELSRWEHHPGQQFELLKPVFNTVSFTAKRKFSVSPKRIDDLIDRELNRLIKSPWSRFTSFFELTLLNVVAFIFVLASTLQGIMVFITYQETSFKVDLAAISEWFETPEDTSVSSPIAIPKSAVGMTPKPVRYMLPKQVTSSKEMGQALAYHIHRQDSRFVIRYVGDASQFNQVTDEAWKWLDRNEPYLMRIYDGGDGQYMDYGYYVDYELTMKYEITEDQGQRVQKKVKQIVQKIPKNWSDHKKVRYINDYIVRHTAYKLKSEESPYTPYSILFNREGVCEGYALTAYLLLQAADVQVRYISGKADGGGHAWNMVKLKNNWYHLDTTWNDPIPNRPDEVQEDYLLVSDQTLSKDHVWNKENYPQTAKVDYEEL
ncbi:transglutaminase domain-containing protein [Exiguobacterium antarcticum]|uniref:Transglutaminase domain-containing protein n=1 Tax=Exiguobacterium antarcticum TaxID=132920 RepID=A0ABT6R619_9BACL|nr:transglutaminase domain-containing protein [Exiguobacterium antarcticum]MDI3236407.1 transglutaminase domain-containing protein [Exiguobacterium antarcticum]